MKFEYWQSKRRWYFHLRARNGEIIFYGEGYRRMIDMKKTISLICRIKLVELPRIRIERS